MKEMEEETTETQPVPNTCCSLKNRLICILTGLVLISVFTTVGFLLGKYSAKSKTLPVSQITPTPLLPTPTIDPTADWKIYTNEKYGYQFKCPSSAIYKVEVTKGDGLVIPFFQEGCFENQNQVRILVEKFLNLNEFEKEAKEKEYQGASLILVDFKEIIINDQKAISYKTKNQFGQIEADVVEVISRTPETSIFIRGFDQAYFDQILSTFKLLE